MSVKQIAKQLAMVDNGPLPGGGQRWCNCGLTTSLGSEGAWSEPPGVHLPFGPRAIKGKFDARGGRIAYHFALAAQ